MSANLTYRVLEPSQVSGVQLRAARVLLGWTKLRASEICKVSVNSIGRFEEEAENITERTVEDIVRSFEAAGVTFVDGTSGAGVFIRGA